MRVQLRSALLRMAEPSSDGPQIDPCLRKVCSSSMAERIRDHIRAEARSLSRSPKRFFDAADLLPVIRQHVWRRCTRMSLQQKPTQAARDRNDWPPLAGLLAAGRIEIDPIVIEIDLRPAEIE